MQITSFRGYVDAQLANPNTKFIVKKDEFGSEYVKEVKKGSADWFKFKLSKVSRAEASMQLAVTIERWRNRDLFTFDNSPAAADGQKRGWLELGSEYLTYGPEDLSNFPEAITPLDRLKTITGLPLDELKFQPGTPQWIRLHKIETMLNYVQKGYHQRLASAGSDDVYGSTASLASTGSNASNFRDARAEKNIAFQFLLNDSADVASARQRLRSHHLVALDRDTLRVNEVIDPKKKIFNLAAKQELDATLVEKDTEEDGFVEVTYVAPAPDDTADRVARRRAELAAEHAAFLLEKRQPAVVKDILQAADNREKGLALAEQPIEGDYTEVVVDEFLQPYPKTVFSSVEALSSLTVPTARIERDSSHPSGFTVRNLSQEEIRAIKDEEAMTVIELVHKSPSYEERKERFITEAKAKSTDTEITWDRGIEFSTPHVSALPKEDDVPRNQRVTTFAAVTHNIVRRLFGLAPEASIVDFVLQMTPVEAERLKIHTGNLFVFRSPIEKEEFLSVLRERAVNHPDENVRAFLRDEGVHVTRHGAVHAGLEAWVTDFGIINPAISMDVLDPAKIARSVAQIVDNDKHGLVDLITETLAEDSEPRRLDIKNIEAEADALIELHVHTNFDPAKLGVIEL